MKQERRLRILLIGGDAVDRSSIEGMVDDHALPYDFEYVESIPEARTRLEAAAFDVILLNHHDDSPPDLSELKATPTILLTGRLDQRVATEAVREGAFDYMVKDPHGFYLRMLPATVHNVLARRRAERARRESEERLKAIIESQPDLIFETDTEGRLTFMSMACREALGVDADRMLGEPLHEYGAGEARLEIKKALASLVTGARELRFFQARWRHTDGSERVMCINARPYFDGEGTAIGGRGSIRDITEFQQMVDALEETKELASRTQRELAQARIDTVRLRGHLGKRADFEGLVGRHPAMLELYEKVRLAAATEVSVHISGPSGSGKELVANALHNLSTRRNRPFVVVNCSAIPETLIESTLFGHVKGAYTGAVSASQGYFGRAEGGTLFLDEIGDLTPLIQVKLLRFLQERSYERVGDPTPRTADVRVITATNQDLWGLVGEGRMREDFYYRISVFPLIVPSLTKRKSDIPLIADHFLKRISERTGRDIRGVASTVMKAFMDHSWPGNVRELENILEYSCVVAADGVIEQTDLPPHFHHRGAGAPLAGQQDSPEYLREVLERSGWNRTRAARELGISRVTLWKRLKAAGIQPPEARGGEE